MEVKIIEKRSLSITKLAIMIPGILMFIYFLYYSISDWNTRPEMHFFILWSFFLVISVYGFIIGLRNMIQKRAKYIFYDDRYQVTQPKNPFEVKFDIITQVEYFPKTKFVVFKIDKYKRKGNIKLWFLVGKSLKFSLNDATNEQIDEIMNNFTSINKDVIYNDKYIFWHRAFAFLL